MAMALITDVADAVVDALNGNHEFSQDFTAERLYLPVFELKDMGVLHVTVGMRSIETTAAARGEVTRKEIKIDVAVQKKLQEIEKNYETDDLMDFVEEVIDFLKPIGKFDAARCYLIENSPVYLPEHMRTLRQFTSVITLSLKVIA
jgi:hypothetical protein